MEGFHPPEIDARMGAMNPTGHVAVAVAIAVKRRTQPYTDGVRILIPQPRDETCRQT